MIDWKIWFMTGIEHILDIGGYDHMLFVALLTFVYPVNEWKKLIGLITAFTVGHSLTLALSVSNIIHLQQEITELLIILTILFTALYQLYNAKNTPKGGNLFYVIICFFGLIHGMGFSYLLKSMLGHNETIVWPLLMFNLGLEVGQLIFVILVFVLMGLITKYLSNYQNQIRISLLSLILITSLYLCYIRVLTLVHS